MAARNNHELLFRTNSRSGQSQNNLYLTPVANERHGLKLTGGIPFLWDYDGQKVVGPGLYDDDHSYQVVDVDYRHNYIWLAEEE